MTQSEDDLRPDRVRQPGAITAIQNFHPDGASDQDELMWRANPGCVCSRRL